MALKIDELRGQGSTRSQFVSRKRLYLTAADEVVEAGDPEARRLLVAAGGSIPATVAEAYGLVTVTPEAVVATTESAARTTTDPEGDARSDRPPEPPQPGELVADQKGNTRRYDDKSLKPEPAPAAPAPDAPDSGAPSGEGNAPADSPDGATPPADESASQDGAGGENGESAGDGSSGGSPDAGTEHGAPAPVAELLAGNRDAAIARISESDDLELLRAALEAETRVTVTRVLEARIAELTAA